MQAVLDKLEPGKSETDLASFYRENGYLVIPGALDKLEIERLREETTSICRGERQLFKGIQPARPDESAAAVLARYLCIHFPHKLSSVMLDTVSHPVIVATLQDIIGPNVKCMQSMLFIKAAGKPGQAWHQDEYFIPTRDRSLTGAWIALDDATTENGCLWVLPGSHKRGIIYPQRNHGDPRFDCTGESYGYIYRDEDAVAVEVKAGSIVFFNGYLLHRSLPNRAQSGFRRALVNHYMSAESLLPWMKPTEGESMATADYRDIVLVCGNDPYTYKGVEELSQAHVRSSGEGGCATPD
jgi:phytanoyl-CoA hydroxylase